MAIIAIIALAIILFIRKRRRGAKSQVSTIENSKDAELFLDDISTSPSPSPSNPQHPSPSFHLKLVLQTGSHMHIEGKTRYSRQRYITIIKEKEIELNIEY